MEGWIHLFDDHGMMFCFVLLIILRATGYGINDTLL